MFDTALCGDMLICVHSLFNVYNKHQTHITYSSGNNDVDGAMRYSTYITLKYNFV